MKSGYGLGTRLYICCKRSKIEGGNDLGLRLAFRYSGGKANTKDSEGSGTRLQALKETCNTIWVWYREEGGRREGGGREAWYMVYGERREGGAVYGLWREEGGSCGIWSMEKLLLCCVCKHVLVFTRTR